MFKALITLCFLASYGCYGQSKPGYRIRVTKTGLEYAGDVAAEVVRKIIKTLPIPAISVSGSGITMSVSDIKVTKFAGASFAPVMQPPDGVMLKMQNGDIEAAGKFSGKVLLTHIGGSVTVSAKGTGLNSAVVLGRDATGRPALNYSACTATIDHFDVRLSGSTFVSIINWFHSIIASSIKPNVLNAICSQLKQAIDGQLHDILGSLPAAIPLDGTNFSIDYRLIDRPVVTEDYIDLDGSGAIDFNGINTDPEEPLPIHPSGQTNKYMAYFWGSQYILDSALYQLKRSEALHFLVTKDSVPGAKAMLATTCPALCVGTIIKEIGAEYPNTYAQLFLNASREVPKISITAKGAFLEANATIMLSVEENSKVIDVAAADLSMKADVIPSLKGGNITGKAYITALQLSQTYSDLTKPIAWEFLAHVAQNILQNEINHLLAIGIPIPSFEGVSVVNPIIGLEDQTIQVATDILFNATEIPKLANFRL